jgi:magnesium-transporting ATPase (P-type)
LSIFLFCEILNHCFSSINTTIGIVQEGSAEQAAEALKNMLSTDAILVRNGTEVRIAANEIVPGDVVILSLGDRVPADLRMIEVSNLACAEAALTGESVPIDKSTDKIDAAGGDPSRVPLGDRHNMAFSATLVSQGSGAGIIVATGDNTEIGTINQLVNNAEDKKTAVLEQIDNVSKMLACFIVFVAIVTFCVAFFTLEDQTWLDALSISLVCAVAMIPEGLEAIVTVTYAYAVSNMAKSNAIIRALPAVETLGSVTVICSDKTGTLTQNIMSLTAFVTSNARYKVDVNSTDRTNKNFVRDDTYMSERADHTKMMKSKDVIKAGPGVSRRGKGRSKSSTDFPYTMRPSVIDDNLASQHATEDPLKEEESKTEETDVTAPAVVDNTPVGPGESPELSFFRQGLAGGVLCSKCTLGKNGTREGEIGNPTELSILRASYWGGIDVNDLKDQVPIIAEVPFSSEYKFMATVHEAKEENDGPGMEGKLVIHVKGAPDRMIPMCDKQARAGLLGETEPVDRDYWIDQIAILSSHGLRVLALLRGSVDKGVVSEGDNLGPEFIQDKGAWLTIVGLCAIMDPPRPECVDAIAESHGAGVRVAMITGDHKDTAIAIGCMLGLVDEQHSSAITGAELDALSDDEIKVAVLKYNVFARASPQNKIRIVKALQAQGEICGMTGDGVNDAPALKAADMGVAMGKEGTDVAREASQMILADDNFATIIVAVREGRVVWDNLRKVLLVNTPINNAQGLSVLFGIIFGLEEIPLTAIQVLYCNLICAVTLGFVCAVEPAEDGIMDNPPRRVGKRLIGRYLLLRIILGTIVLVACTVESTFIAMYMYDDLEGDDDGSEQLALMRSQASNTLTFSAISITLSARFAYNSAIHPRLFKGNVFCWYSVAIVAVLQVAITYIPWLNETIFSMGPMKAAQWGIVLVCMVITFVVMEAEKALRRVLKSMGTDTDDTGYGYFDQAEAVPNQDISLPKGASHLNLTELSK